MIQPTWLNFDFQAIAFLFSELLSITDSLQPQRLERTENDRVHSTFREKRIRSPQYLNFPFLPSNRLKANTTLQREVPLPVWVMKRHHLVDIALHERLHRLAEKIPVQPIPNSVNGSIKDLYNEKNHH